MTNQFFTIKDSNNSIGFVQQALAGFERQIPYATMLTLNETANDIKAGLVDEMKRVFDRPTNYALNGLFVLYAQKSTQTAVISFKDKATNGGTPAINFLAPHVLGGDRKTKRFERSLQLNRLMPSRLDVIPGNTVRLNQYGNMSRASISQILSTLGARSAKPSKEAYFVADGKTGGLSPGVYQRKSNGDVLPIMPFVKQATYKRRFNFFGVAQQVADKVMSQNAERAVLKALVP